ncbi:16S rRNA (cytosine(967)-C(5))-methyltransferase RsmB [Salinimonas sp. HHU 13199]|uniref:16S rRNA (cytosine(967)-C(5))-methyltransferase n=1 Tax=Salinimonas profundi TaxID=2729140 RepID=A0ABR8LJA1_9ALTE|nr:16S rRNA (cytosine(967)-C(5))-methyltransferase RsmB [Salinimonas profundi]MBD3585832.1 16S rRNA (cytosine(967)-C(5))-methyltransferase RsmB [Salinimonas profundi]
MNAPLPRKKNLRGDAAWVIFQILENGKSSRDCLAKVQQRHSSKDSAWLQEMTMGTMRQLPQLQIWLRHLLDKPLKGNKKILEHLMMLGFYQLAFSRVSPHAAVAETVNAAPALGGDSLKGLVNAVLRNFQRQEMHTQLSDDPIVKSGLPKWLYQALSKQYGDNADGLRAQANAIAPLWLRINARKISRQAYSDMLTEAGVEHSLSGDHPQAIIVQSRTDVVSLPGFTDGLFAVQDGAAQLAAYYLGAQDGDRILDCCAAPGGKTGHIIETTTHLQSIIALDSDGKRLTRVKENMRRLGHTATIVEGDAAKPADWWDGKHFDRILLDAPCSATGVIRRHPDIRWLRKKSDIDALIDLQASILDALWPLVKPSGTLLYATCSVLQVENSEQMRRFLARYEDASLQPLTATDTMEMPGRQILPGEQQMDGFYYCRLLKSSN